jgi:uncharacterized membrane protein
MADLPSLTITHGFALAIGVAASTIALYGRYRELPRFLTGPRVCRLEAGGCEVLFRTRQASLLGLPNALLALVLYALLLVGLTARWPATWLLTGATAALAMSIYLARYLLRNHLQCRICWAGHIANVVLWVSLVARFVAGKTWTSNQ